MKKIFPVQYADAPTHPVCLQWMLPFPVCLGDHEVPQRTSFPHTYAGNLWDSQAQLLSSRIRVHTRLPTDVRVQVPVSTLEGL